MDGTGESNKITEFNIYRKIFVGNVSYRIKSRKLAKFFSKFGPVEYCYIVKDHIKKWSRGIAFVTFKDEDSMQRALEAPEEELFFDQRQMRVKPAELSTRATYWQDRQMSDDSDSEGERISETDMISSQVDLSAPCLIDTLYDDVLLQIFSLLTWRERIAVERVCGRWKGIIQRSWASQRHVHFQNIFRQFQGLTDKMLNCVLIRCGHYLESLDLSASPRVLTDFSMDIIGKYCPQIKELNLSYVNMTDISLGNLVSRCTNLHVVKLKRCLHITDKGVKTVLSSGQPLKHLDISENSHLSGQCFKNIQQDLCRLKALVLTGCCKIGETHFSHLIGQCRNLEELNISGCRGLSGASLKTICQTCVCIRRLNTSGVNFDIEALLELKKLSLLEDLNLSHCHLVNDTVLEAVSEGCKGLRELDVSVCHCITDRGITSLSQLQQLEAINLSYLNQVTETSVIRLAQSGNLVRFIARATRFPTDDVIIRLIDLCPRLRHLDLCSCFQITNKIFNAFKIEDEKKMDLVLGGTSVDWISDDVDWVRSGFANLNVSMHNLAINDLRADSDIVLPSPDEENWDDEFDEYPPHPPLSAYQQDAVEMCDEWSDDDFEDDDFLDNDDPLAYERWNMS